MKSAKHAAGKDRLASKQAREKHISDMLKEYDQEVDPAGENLPNAVRVYRVMVVETFLEAGVPLEKNQLLSQASGRKLASAYWKPAFT